jgi:hypothetical protein
MLLQFGEQREERFRVMWKSLKPTLREEQLRVDAAKKIWCGKRDLNPQELAPGRF